MTWATSPLGVSHYVEPAAYRYESMCGKYNPAATELVIATDSTPRCPHCVRMVQRSQPDPLGAAKAATARVKYALRRRPVMP